MTDKLKPCPFCGGESVGVYYSWGLYSSRCNDCRFEINIASKVAAIAAWNKRTPPKVKPLVFEESKGVWFSRPVGDLKLRHVHGRGWRVESYACGGGGIFETREEAEQAAQDHWRAFILSAIEE